MKMREVGPSIGTCGVALLAMLIFTNACLNMGAESFTGNLGEPLHQANCTRVLIVYHSETNWTKAFAEYVMQGAYDASKNTSVPTDVILTSVEEATCDQLVWADGIILGSPVYFGVNRCLLCDALHSTNTCCTALRFNNRSLHMDLADYLGCACDNGVFY
eukprot:m.74674 g.74674  ORF g.74674 m.74674 type:complete len:160 (+) comp12406_c1_seq10:254-733(+)